MGVACGLLLDLFLKYDSLLLSVLPVPRFCLVRIILDGQRSENLSAGLCVTVIEHSDAIGSDLPVFVFSFLNIHLTATFLIVTAFTVLNIKPLFRQRIYRIHIIP